MLVVIAPYRCFLAEVHKIRAQPERELLKVHKNGKSDILAKFIKRISAHKLLVFPLQCRARPSRLLSSGETRGYHGALRLSRSKAMRKNLAKSYQQPIFFKGYMSNNSKRYTHCRAKLDSSVYCTAQESFCFVVRRVT
jgi:hypothetical protein